MTEKQPHIVVTGASGFIGTHVMQALAAAGEYPVGLCRKPTKGLVHGFDLMEMGDLSKVLSGAKAVVHCAARVHSKEDPKTELDDHRKANRDGTADLLRQAEAAGVQHFVFLSTVAVYGLQKASEVIALNYPSAPNTAYGQAKLEAEAIVQACPMRSTILRVPLVYGPHAPGNWRKLMRLCQSGYPLPFGFVGNRRSMIAVQNLADLIRHCLQSDDTPEVILATDHDDLGTTRICTELRKAMGKPRRLFAVPKPLMSAGATLVRRPYLYEQLFESLQFSATDCGWTPPLTADQALHLCVTGTAAGK
ncbi:NAD-dependent epimerase/dehydratase family protein [Cognatishimia maritima]|uniref:Nucleoside-diphosphate-sugar epimerase n=1 Tax=Cognatishimia maritima TaxID=870908 RepID=A0A1M5I8P7_9RHOB|nr:NAD-dependent epimerase/dehydratase family protein [Cognatishimia maritima]SHG24260.1 Nucleoside-diphosphate-sugar epimerase [Cognatishimia maritima]